MIALAKVHKKSHIRKCLQDFRSFFSHFLCIGVPRVNERSVCYGGSVEHVVDKLGKTRIKIIELIVSNPNITYAELSSALSVSSTTIEKRIAEMSGVIIKRNGPKNGGHWEIIDKD